MLVAEKKGYYVDINKSAIFFCQKNHYVLILSNRLKINDCFKTLSSSKTFKKHLSVMKFKTNLSTLSLKIHYFISYEVFSSLAQKLCHYLLKLNI